MKKCSRCKQEKNYEGFYKDAKAKDGFNSICKLCRLQMDRDRRKNDPVWVEKRKVQNSEFHYQNRDAIAERKKEWLNSENGKKLHRASAKRRKENNVDKRKAHGAVERAVRNGLLVKPKKCQLCNSTKRIEAHHHDYRKTLSVLWVCKKCHVKLT